MIKAICSKCDKPIYLKPYTQKWKLIGHPGAFDVGCIHYPKKGTIT